MKRKELKIKKIKNGTVIDHLPAGSSLNILEILGVGEGYKNSVSVAMNVKSGKGRKDIVKIEDKVLKSSETDKLALIAPHATINIIKKYEVKKKNKVSTPDEFSGIVTCANPNCITNKKEPVIAEFSVENKEPIQLRCKFCERIMDKDQVQSHL